jgi:deoxyadenosine/deoxycytidine kinase
MATPPGADDDQQASGLRRFRHIVVEGPIGVGKSSLARRLAQHLGAELLLEAPEENPFLGRFYDDMPGYAFQTQLFFLFQRAKQMQAIAQPGMFEHTLVSDFLFAKDSLFARLTLSDDEHRLYTQIYAPIAAQLSEPDLVIWLQAEPATLLHRIRKRGVRMERKIEAEYLQRLCDAYVQHFHSYDGAPVFAVGTERFNPVERDADFAALLERLANFRGRREFLNIEAETPISGPRR